MQVSVENTSSIGRRLTVCIPAEQVDLAINQKMSEVLRTKKLDGFRPGKAPKQLIQQKYGLQIRHEAISKIIEMSLPTVLKQESLEPAGRPEVEQISHGNEEDKDLTYVVSFEIFPEFNLPEFSSLNIEKYQAQVREVDVEKAIEKLKHQLAHWKPVDRKAQKGDRLTINYSSLLNGKSYENNSGKDVMVELGSNVFIEGFEEGLLGAKVNDTCEMDLHFPSEWRIQEFAGKPVHFVVQVKEISEKHLAELDEAFAKKIGCEASDEVSIRNKVCENLEKQIVFAVEEKTKKQVLDKLLASNSIELPKALIEHEVHLLHEDLHRKMGNEPHDTCQHQGLEEEAKRRVGLSLILRKIVQSENLKPDEAKVKTRILEISKSFGNAEFIENMYRESEELLTGIQNSVLVDQAIDLILSKASIILKPVTMEELFKQI